MGKQFTLTKEEFIQRSVAGEKFRRVKTGEVFYYDGSCSAPFRTSDGSIDARWDVFNKNVRFEVYKEPKPFWKPKNGVKAWCLIDDNITLADALFNLDNRAGAFHETKEDAEKALKLCRAKQRVKEAVWNLNGGGWYPFEAEGENFTISFYDYLYCEVYESKKVNPSWLYLKDVEACGKLIESHREDLITILSE